ncbi:DUF7507 domain-containing protein [Microlunatus antarcticus]|uniref:DUF7507 domain-containing protein n=1 Tax=Microlunatus antarcticus TaxID=53388 RepID=A0A7W5JYM4_9ACTN|nr:hypothetical protein [Microlunatus antarcticus]MBB3328695.1 hypothetical protein [Microlunatus antarcticus]
MSALAGTPVRRRARRRLLGALTALAIVLALQLGRPPAASAAETGPTAVDDSAVLALGSPQIVLPGSHDDVAGSAFIQPSLTAFPTDQLASLPPGSSVTYYRIVDAGFGTWSIGDADGRITFRPTGVTGTRTVRYRVVDGNERTDEGTATVTVSAVAGARSDVVATVEGASATVDVLANDVPSRDADGSPGAVDRTSVRWLESETSPGIVSRDGLVVTVPGVGVFTIGATTGLVTFVPEAGYVTPDDGTLTYTAQDTTRASDARVVHHEISSTVRWRVTTAARVAVAEKAGPDLFFHVGDLLTFTTTITNAGTSPLAGLRLTHSFGSRLSADACAPVALGGTLPAGSSTTCTTTTRAKQGDIDSEEARVSDVVVATGTSRAGGSPVTVRAQNGAFTATRITQRLTMTATTNRTSVSAAGQQLAYALVVRNNGNRSVRDLVVSSSTADVPALVCAPVPLGGTLGDNRTTTCRATRTVRATDLQYAGLDAVVKVRAVPVSGAHRTAVSTGLVVRTPVDSRGVTVSPVPPAPAPTAAPDTVSTTVGQPVVVDVLADDRPGSPDVPLVGSSVRLRTTTALPPGSVLYGDAKTLTVPGRGVLLVSGTGQITFVPLGASTGPVPTIGYQVADAGGRTARSTLDVTVR